MPKRFQPEQFHPTQWATAEHKAQWATAMASWVSRGFPPEGFRKQLYEHLRNMYGHIAHYNREGFYGEWFGDIHRQLKWLQYVARGGAFGQGVGDPHFTWSDVEAAFSAWVQQSGLVERYQQRCAQAIEARERAQLAALLRKYPDVVGSEPAEPPPSDDLERLLVADAPAPTVPPSRTVVAFRQASRKSS